MFKLKASKIIERELIGKPAEGGGYEPRLQFYRIQYWSSGEIWLSERPELSNYDPQKGINLYDSFQFEDWTFEDGHHEWSFPDSMSEKDKAQVIKTDDEGDLCDEGWEVIESETWFYGPLVLEEFQK